MGDTVDKIEKLDDGSVIQHGVFNNRVYLMKLGLPVSKTLLQDLLEKAQHNKYSKIFAKIPETAKTVFQSAGFNEEACIPGLYNGTEKGCFMGRYLDPSRAVEKDEELLDRICELAISKAHSVLPSLDSEAFKLRPCNEQDVSAMARLYKTVFPSYPFPIDNPDYLLETMRSHVDYFGMEVNGQLVALSSSEKDMISLNVEMTDFATLPKWRGHQLGCHLLDVMEDAMKEQGIKTAYTIARAYSHGMNITFSKSGYHYGGRLKNNTNIFGKLESMNIWYKSLSQQSD